MNGIIDIFEPMKLQAVVKTTTACTVLFRGRYIDEQLQITQFISETFIPSVLTGAEETKIITQLPNGKLLTLDVSVEESGIQRGQLAVSCGLLRKDAGTTPFVRLMSGYVTSFKGIDLSSGFEDLQSGRGFISKTLAEPNADEVTISTSKYVVRRVQSILLTVSNEGASVVGMVPSIGADSSQQNFKYWMESAPVNLGAGGVYRATLFPGSTYRKEYSDGFICVVDCFGQDLFLTEENTVAMDMVGNSDLFMSMIMDYEEWLKN